MLRSARDDNVAASGKRSNLQRILQALPPIHISGHYCQRLDFKFRRIQSQYDRHGIVRARIGIDNHSLRRRLREPICREGKNEKTKAKRQKSAMLHEILSLHMSL